MDRKNHIFIIDLLLFIKAKFAIGTIFEIH